MISWKNYYVLKIKRNNKNKMIRNDFLKKLLLSKDKKK